MATKGRQFLADATLPIQSVSDSNRRTALVTMGRRLFSCSAESEAADSFRKTQAGYPG
jgi:hypothetical protein